MIGILCKVTNYNRIQHSGKDKKCFTNAPIITSTTTAIVVRLHCLFLLDKFFCFFCSILVVLSLMQRYSSRLTKYYRKKFISKNEELIAQLLKVKQGGYPIISSTNSSKRFSTSASQRFDDLNSSTGINSLYRSKKSGV